MRYLATFVLLAGLGVAGAASAQSPSTQLHDALNLTVVQEDNWRAYQRAVAPDPQQDARAREAAALLPSLPTPRRLALIRAQMQADLGSFDAQAAAVRTFYATLTPEQQRIFDRQTAAAMQTDR